MKTTLARITVLTVVIVAVLLSVLPQRETNAVTLHTTGIPSVNTHSRPERATWMDAKESLYIPAHTAGYLLGDCYADRTADDLYPQPDPYCLPVPSVENVNVKQDTDVHIVTVDMPATPNVDNETPVIIDEGGEVVPSDDTPSADADKKHCNKGEGNGGEGCDPGNHPERGNDDENQSTPKEDKNKPNKSVVIGMLITFVIGRSKKHYDIDGVRSIKQRGTSLGEPEFPPSPLGFTTLI